MASLKEAPETAPAILIDLSLDKISPWKDNPRKSPGEEEIAELAASLKDVGPIQPIVVRPVDSKITFGVTIAEELEYRGRDYVIVCGERRFHAANLAGLKTLPAIVRDMTREQALKIAIIENLQREDVNAIDEARSLDMLLKETDLTQEAVGEKIGKSQAYIANRVRLLELPASVIGSIAAGELSASHGKVLLKLKRWPAVVEYVAKKAIKENDSVAELESDITGGWHFFYYMPDELRREINGTGPNECTDRACEDLYDGHCLNPECFDSQMQKLAAAQRKEDKELLKKLTKEGKKVKSVPDIKNMAYGSYERLEFSTDPKLSECEAANCEYLAVARGHGEGFESICVEPKCFKKQQRAATVAYNKGVKQRRAELVSSAAQAAGRLEDIPNYVIYSLLRKRLNPGYVVADQATEFADAFGIAINKKGDVTKQIFDALDDVPFGTIAQMLVYFWILDQENIGDWEGDSRKRGDAHKADTLLGRDLRKFRN